MPAFNRPDRGVLVTAVMVRGSKQVQSIGGGHTPDTAFTDTAYFSSAVPPLAPRARRHARRRAARRRRTLEPPLFERNPMA